ncbi:MAG: PKD domain-containing protein [Bacteroidetes bacterium]|nr:PKD domain-containing protein [Bacteroidota bacterium]
MKQLIRFLSVLLILVLPIRAAAQIGFPYCESFQTAGTQANTKFGGNAQLIPGVLRLTSNQLNQRGHVYLDVPFPSNYGLKAEFEYFSYGGAGPLFADGLTVFLFDGDTPVFNAGGFGGSLGYAPRNQEPGLSNAYLGIGFDEFGNFGNNKEGRIGSFINLDQDGRAPDAIVLRGPSNQGYPFVVGRRTNEVGPAKNGLNPGDQFTISSGGTTRVTDRNKPGFRKVFLELQPISNGPGFFLKLTMEVTTEINKPRTATIFDGAYQFPAPKNLKMGFAGSTGGFTNFHEIRNLIVEVAADDALQNPEGVDFTDKASCAGQLNQFYITDEEVRLPNENSSIRCLQFYASLADIKAESEDICTQARCLEQNRVLIVPQGIFQASDQAGGYTFLPNEAFIDQQLTVYYTITDNYGKTSQPNSITLLIKESPDPIALKASGATQAQNEVVICEGDSVKLVGEGNEAYYRFEWKKNGVLLPDAASQELVVDALGVYEVIGYNRKNCPAISNKIEVKWVVYPELKLTKPIVGCTIGQSLDIRNFLAGFDSQLYDYRMVGEGLDLENKELQEVSTSGQFELQVKPKGYACYSDPFPVEVYIQEKALEVTFDFEVAGTGIKDDAGGGIFPDDVIQFTDLSEARVVNWEWDFGDKTSSAGKDPTHIFGKKGEFEVVLVATDRYGCQNRFTKTVQITKSYRLMIPNAFTPLQSENKTFVPKYKGLVRLELSVFNLWGELIYRSSDLDKGGWDGTMSGALQEAGFYFYSLVGEASDGEKVESNGKFRLIR